MKKDKAVVKKVPVKNYLIVGLIILGVILGSVYAYRWYKVYSLNKVSESYLMSNKVLVHEVKDLSEVESVFSETPNEYFVYVSYTKNKDTYQLEEDLRPIIEDYKLKDFMYYINVTDIKDEDDYIDKVNKALGLKDEKIKQVPTIIFFQDGKVEKNSIITREDKSIMQAGDFAHLLDIKGIKKDR